MIRVRSKDKHKQPTDNYQCFLISCKSSGLFIHTHIHTQREGWRLQPFSSNSG